MTVAEAAAFAKKNPETIRRWIREGKLAAKKDSREDWVIQQDDLTKCINTSLLQTIGMAAISPTAGMISAISEMIRENKDKTVIDTDLMAKHEMELELQSVERQIQEAEAKIVMLVKKVGALQEKKGRLNAALGL